MKIYKRLLTHYLDFYDNIHQTLRNYHIWPISLLFALLFLIFFKYNICYNGGPWKNVMIAKMLTHLQVNQCSQTLAIISP